MSPCRSSGTRFDGSVCPPPPQTEVGERLGQLSAESNPGGCVTPGVHVEVDNKGSERLELIWISRQTPSLQYRLGEAALGKSYVRVPAHVQAQVFSNKGYVFARHVAVGHRDNSQASRYPNYRLQVVCSESIDPTKR